MSAIESCRTAALGGHVARCQDCAYTTIAYNSCRNRHCPKCQGAAAKQWLAERAAELLPVPYFHVVFTLPAPIADIAYQNKAAVYDLLFKVSAETMLTIPADPKHLGARIGTDTVKTTPNEAASAYTRHSLLPERPPPPLSPPPPPQPPPPHPPTPPCWPTPPAPTTPPAPANCSLRKSQKATLPMPMLPITTS